jgi:hypothetical protein
MPGKTERKSAGVLAGLTRSKVKSFEACPGYSTAAMRWRPAGASGNRGALGRRQQREATAAARGRGRVEG